MQILQTSPPRLDAADAQSNFVALRQYLQSVTENIDFILAKYAGSLKAVDADGVSRQLAAFEARMVTLERAVTQLKNVQNTQGAALSALEEEAVALRSGLTQAQERLADHETRIAALENAGGEA